MRYAIVNTKGGVGKTTVAVHLATMLARGGSVLLIDGDSQQSAASWAAWRREGRREPAPTTVSLNGKAILDEGRKVAIGFTHTVVDAGGRDAPGLRAALLLAERAIIPVGASSLDAAALDDLMEILTLSRDFNPELKAFLLLTRIDSRTRDAGELLDYLKDKDLPILQSRITERVAYRRAVGEGAIVQETHTDPQANTEMEALLQELTT